MKKNDFIKTAASILIIIVLAVIIVNASKFISTEKAPTEQQTIQNNEGVDYSDCFSGSPDTVVFVYSNSCPHCHNMMPIIQELEGEGHKFYWAESSDAGARQVINECFSDLMSGYVPQFICPPNGEEITGEMSKSELKAFAEECGQ